MGIRIISDAIKIQKKIIWIKFIIRIQCIDKFLDFLWKNAGDLQQVINTKDKSVKMFSTDKAGR